MLKYMPLYGSILLTIIIAWIVISTIIGNRRKIGAALAGNHYVNLRSLCCAAEITPIVWTADGWVAACRECGAWQYFGDDFNEISENIITSDSRRSPAPRPSAVNGPESLATGLRPNCTCDTVRYINGDHLPDCPTQRIGFMESNPGSEVTSDRYSPAQAEMLRDDYRQAHPEIAALWDTPEGRQAVSNAALSVAIADEGEMTELRGSGVIDFDACQLGAQLPSWEAGRIDAGGNVTWKRGMSLSGGIVLIHAEELPKALEAGWALASEKPEDDGRLMVSREPRPAEAISEHPIHRVEPSMAERDAMFDEGEPLAMPPQPNIGGEGHPDYQGPHYAVPHDRFVPYDVLRDPPEGAAVHIVGNVACVGPLEVEEDRGRATLDSSREDEDGV